MLRCYARFEFGGVPSLAVHGCLVDDFASVDVFRLLLREESSLRMGVLFRKRPEVKNQPDLAEMSGFV